MSWQSSVKAQHIVLGIVHTKSQAKQKHGLAVLCYALDKGLRMSRI